MVRSPFQASQDRDRSQESSEPVKRTEDDVVQTLDDRDTGPRFPSLSEATERGPSEREDGCASQNSGRGGRRPDPEEVHYAEGEEHRGCQDEKAEAEVSTEAGDSPFDAVLGLTSSLLTSVFRGAPKLLVAHEFIFMVGVGKAAHVPAR